jgi:hypothetical protein
MHLWIFREPALRFGVPVCLFAVIVFPLHLGWTGASPFAFAGYLLIAGVLFSVADALLQPSFYPKWSAIISQSVLSLLGLAVPAGIFFLIGTAIGPVEEQLEDQYCAKRGTAEISDASAEADDTFDPTPDCAEGPA